MYNFKEVEKQILEFWRENKIYEKLKGNLKGKKPFYYLDGPPYTSGKVHVGTAWGKALRDCLMRYKRMKGFDVWDRAGFDMHGLPIERAAEKELGIKDKEEIEKYGVNKYVKFCEELAVKNMKSMITDFRDMGVWMDFDDPYMSIKSEYIEGVWWLVKKAHEKGRLYEGLRTMPWCAECGTANAKHELEYKNITEDSIFVKFKVQGVDEYLTIWTSTPWTISFNLAIMVNPEKDYVKAKVENEVWIIAKDLVNVFISNVVGKPFEIIEEFKGEKLDGLKYEHPFEKYVKAYKELEKKSNRVHTVVLSEEYVDTTSGTGLVHCAPGCGPEDYEVGHAYGIPPYNTLTEHGIFDASIEKFKGLKAKKDDKFFIDLLKEEGALISTTKVEHEYAHCWRCHEPVIYRTTKQWFFKIEDLKENMKELNKEVKWVPDWAGSRQFHSWLDNLRDNSISKQRFWGTPLPVWKCGSCKKYDVVGSIDELKEKAGKLPENLHKPWIDEISWKCECGSLKRKIPDVIDVWVDAGCASWLCLDYPKRKDLFEKLYPADFILEGKDQIRGWFNILFVCSMIAFDKPSYKGVYMHGFINDAQGRKMSKSLGNYIMPEEVIEKYGVDAMRYYMVGGANAGLDLNYNFDDMKVKQRNLGILWNLGRFLIDYAEQNNFGKDTEAVGLSLEEKYMYSKLHSSIKKASELFDNYELYMVPEIVEDLFLSLSRDYIKYVREKSVSGTGEEKAAIFCIIYNCYLNTLKLLAPVVPFIVEKLYLDLKKKFNLEEDSIHLFEWPFYEESLIDRNLEENFELVNIIIQGSLSVRDNEKIGLRWPLKKAVVYLHKDKDLKSLVDFEDLLKSQINVKAVEFKFVDKSLIEKVEKGVFRYGYVSLDFEITPELEKEGYARELVRRIQAARKKAGLKKQDNIDLGVGCDVGLEKFGKDIGEKVGAVKLRLEKSIDVSGFKYVAKDKIKGKEFVIGFNVV